MLNNTSKSILAWMAERLVSDDTEPPATLATLAAKRLAELERWKAIEQRLAELERRVAELENSK